MGDRPHFSNLVNEEHGPRITYEETPLFPGDSGPRSVSQADGGADKRRRRPSDWQRLDSWVRRFPICVYLFLFLWGGFQQKTIRKTNMLEGGEVKKDTLICPRMGNVSVLLRMPLFDVFFFRGIQQETMGGAYFKTPHMRGIPSHHLGESPILTPLLVPFKPTKKMVHSTQFCGCVKCFSMQPSSYKRKHAFEGFPFRWK